MLRVFFGRHKCASQWITLILERICNELGWKYVHAYQVAIDQYGGLQELIDGEKPDVLIIPESKTKWVRAIQVPFIGFHVTRDPRDIVISGYFSHKGSHYTGGIGLTDAHKEELRVLPEEEGINLEIETLAGEFISFLYEWDYDHPNIFETRFERITVEPYDEFCKILEFMKVLDQDSPPLFQQWAFWNRLVRRMGLAFLTHRMERYPAVQLARSLHHLSFSNLKSGKLKRLGQKTDHYRKGRSGTWKEHLTPAQERRITERFPGIIEKLGYTASPSTHDSITG